MGPYCVLLCGLKNEFEKSKCWVVLLLQFFFEVIADKTAESFFSSRDKTLFATIFEVYSRKK